MRSLRSSASWHVPVERLSKRGREITPPDLAEFLVESVRLQLQCAVVAALWTCMHSPYGHMRGVESWGIAQDALAYPGPWPIVAHPPCGPWGKYKRVALESRTHGIRAMQLVHKFGGVVEQPVGSSLFAEHGQGGRIEKIFQCDFGHPSEKQTLLYWYM